MKQINKRILSLLLLLALVCTVFTPANAAAAKNIITTPTGYNSADDVEYKRTNGTIHNWGARGEDCVFLSTYAAQFYTGSNTYATLSVKAGSKYQNDVPASDLYKALQTLMKSNHTHQTTYGDTRYQYCYTDCVSNDSSQISSFYSGKLFDSDWDQGATWNREHTWPASKSLSGRPNNSDAGEGADIMMLRPTLTNENGSRGNTAYGESRGYFDPGVDIRGDCARILLYTYVRWGNTSNMWGSSGVIENQNILFKWMQEDPVDTWEMGRNDAVQSITGTRNVFVDYPELAFLLFGREIPSGMVTPSGEAKNGTPSTSCSHSNTDIRGDKDATCTASGYTGDTVCRDCGATVDTGTTVPATGHKNGNSDDICDVCGASMQCKHQTTQVRDAVEATCTAEGYSGDTYCTQCSALITQGKTVPVQEHVPQVLFAKDPTCCHDGYTGDTYCAICQKALAMGEDIPATGEHSFGEWVITKEATKTESGSKERICSVGGYKETMEIPKTGSDPMPTKPTDTESDATESSGTQPGEETPTKPNSVIVIIVSVIVGSGVLIGLLIALLKKKRQN